MAQFKYVGQQAATINRGARVFESLIVNREVVERATMGTDHGGGYLAAASAGIKACPQAMWDAGGPLHTTLFNPLFQPQNLCRIAVSTSDGQDWPSSKFWSPAGKPARRAWLRSGRRRVVGGRFSASCWLVEDKNQCRRFVTLWKLDSPDSYF